MGFATAARLNLPDRVQAFVEIPLSPERGRVPIDLQLRSDLQVRLACRRQQQDARAQGYLLRRELSADPLLKLSPIGIRKRDGRSEFGHANNISNKSQHV